MIESQLPTQGSPPPRRWSFSLLRLLALTAVVGFYLATVRQYGFMLAIPLGLCAFAAAVAVLFLTPREMGIGCTVLLGFFVGGAIPVIIQSQFEAMSGEIAVLAMIGGAMLGAFLGNYLWK